MSGFGDLYVDLETALDTLRPRPGEPRRYLGPEHCSECGGHFVHDDGCLTERREGELEERRPHEIDAHRWCHEILAEVWEHTDALLRDVEGIALYLRGDAMPRDSTLLTVDVPAVVLSVMWDSLPSFELLNAPRLLAAELSPPLTSRDWCRDEYHSAPHRACRHLLG